MDFSEFPARFRSKKCQCAAARVVFEFLKLVRVLELRFERHRKLCKLFSLDAAGQIMRILKIAKINNKNSLKQSLWVPIVTIRGFASKLWSRF